MALADEYRRQFAWRSWSRILDALPPVEGKRVLDLGCGPGDQAAEFIARGASVVGIDLNEELLREARARSLPKAEFRIGDLRALSDMGDRFDGIWCSFAAAYFPNLAAVLPLWLSPLKPGGWLALTEVDDLFGHEPLPTHVASLLEAYAADALATGRYDFHMGRKLPDHVRAAGLRVRSVFTVDDRELSFMGPADTDVLEAWDLRFQRMKLLQTFCGSEFEAVRAEFMACLQSLEHRSRAQVYCCIAVK